MAGWRSPTCNDDPIMPMQTAAGNNNKRISAAVLAVGLFIKPPLLVARSPPPYLALRGTGSDGTTAVPRTIGLSELDQQIAEPHQQGQGAVRDGHGRPEGAAAPARTVERLNSKKALPEPDAAHAVRPEHLSNWATPLKARVKGKRSRKPGVSVRCPREQLGGR